MTCSRLYTKILPSPILPVRAAFSMASMACSTMASSTAASILVFGKKSTTYSAPRYSSVCPFRSDLTGPGGFFNGFDGLFDDGVVDGGLDLGLRQEVHHVLGATVQLRVPFLTPETFDFRDGDALHVDGRKRFTHFVELERLDDGGYQFHGKARLKSFGDAQHGAGAGQILAFGTDVGLGIGVDGCQRDGDDAEILGHTDLVVGVRKCAVVLDGLVAHVQVQHVGGREVDVGAHVEVAAALAVGGAEQIGGGVRVFDVAGTVTDLAVQFKGVGVGGQAVGRIEIVEAADVVADAGDDLALLAAVDVPLDVAVAASILDPVDGRQPGAEIQAGGIVDVIGAALQRRLQARLGNAPVAVVGGDGRIEAELVVRLGRVLGVGDRGGESTQGEAECCD